MTGRSLALALTEKAFSELFRQARFVPADKLNWKPAESSRSILSLLQECAQCPVWAVGLLNHRKMPDFTPELLAELSNEREGWTTVDACEAEAKNRLTALKEAIEQFPEDDMEKTIFLPFGGGRDFAFWEVMTFPYWNVTYHLGQMCYVETMYGDTDMH